MSDTFQNNKRIAKNTIVLYIRMLLVMAVTVYTSRVVLDVLGIEDYGIYNIVGGIIGMLSVMSSSMGVAVQRFLTFEIGKGDEAALRKVFSISFFAHVVLAVLIFAFAETAGLWFVENKLTIPEARMDAALWVYHCVVLSTFVAIIQVPYTAMLFAKEEMSFFANIGIVEVIFRLMIVYMLTLWTIDKLKLYGVLMLAVQVIISVIFIGYVRHRYKETKISSYRDFSLFGTITSFALWTLVGELAWAFTGQGVNIILNIFFGPAVNASKGVAEQVNSAVSRFVQNFQQAVNPQLIKYYALSDFEEVKKLLYMGTKVSLYLQLLFSVPLILEMDYVLDLWLKETPPLAAGFCRLMLVTNLVANFSNLLSTISRASGNIKKFQAVCAVVTFMNFPLSYLALYLGCDPLSTMFVNIGVSCSLLFTRFLLTKDLIGISLKEYFAEVVTPCAVIVVVSFIPPALVRYSFEASIIRFLSTVLVSVLSVLTFAWTIGLNCQERSMIISVIKSKILKHKEL